MHNLQQDCSISKLNRLVMITYIVIPAPLVIPAEAGIQEVNSSRNPEVVPAEAGNYNKMELDSRFHGKPWIPHPPIVVEGRQVRNDTERMDFTEVYPDVGR